MVRSDTNAAREMRIAEIKRQIAVGVYETPEKLEHAIEAFLDSSAVFLDSRTDAESPHEKPVPRPRPK